MLFELLFEAFKQSKRVSGTACKACDNLIFIKPSHFARVALHHGVALRNLSIAADYHFIAASN
jgi:hypothetical protein